MTIVRENVGSGEVVPAVLWSVLAGPVAWAADLGFSYVLAQHSCSTGHSWALHLITGICLVIALSGLVLGFAEFRKFFEPASEKGGRPIDRAFFFALLGIVFSISFTVVVLAGAVPRWILNPCD